jgi:hypothetical protein
MSKKLLALIAGLLLLLTIGVGTAAADPPPAVQTVGQSAGNTQAAGAESGAAQVQPTNANISVRVLSPGNNGSVSQTNSASSQAAAGNANGTTQSAGQTQGGSGTQAAGQAAGSKQSAGALSNALQLAGLNGNAPSGTLSPGSGGDTTQGNADTSSAAAGNANGTDQGATQSQAGSCGCEGSGSQTVGQAASNDQKAAAASEAKQIEPTNTNISVRVLSPGDDGDVTQSNTVDSSAKAGNLNGTGQSATQTQGGASGGGAGSQTIGQAASNEQAAGALSVGAQEGAKNVNLPIRVLSPGNDGDVTQTNSVDSSAAAGNANWTGQTAKQSQDPGKACGCDGKGSGTQVIGQAAENKQGALAGSAAIQKDAKNVNLPIRVLSPGSGGDVTQTNAVSSSAAAGNLNGTRQDATQTQGDGKSTTPCGCGGKEEQVIGQAAENKQAALAGSLAIQKDAKNANAPIRVLSYGSDGDVTQSNSVDSEAKAGNWNGTSQSATQAGGGAGGTRVQVIGQDNSNAQLAASLSAAAQFGAKNVDSPIRVLSPGGGGSVSQENAVSSSAAAGNLNWTGQSATQSQSSNCGCRDGRDGKKDGKDGIGVQAIGQASTSEQAALSASFGLQKDPVNVSRPIDVLSPGRSGDLSQSNSVDSSSKAGNLNYTSQSAAQTQGAGSGIAVQAIGQYATNAQLAGALSFAAQFGAKNKNAPIDVLSPSCGCKDGKDGKDAKDAKHGKDGMAGKIGQSNEASSTGLAGNKNGASQQAMQTQLGRCLCATPVTKDFGPDASGSTPMTTMTPQSTGPYSARRDE